LTQQDYEDALILNQFEEEDVEEIIQKEPKRKKYDLRSRSNTPKVDIPVPTKKTNALLRTKHQYSIEKPQEKYSTP
jgi:hypothetical protein